MISDIIHVSNGGAGISTALDHAEKTAAYEGLSLRDSLHLRLFAEEMLGMMQALTGEQQADFWIEAENGSCRLHLKLRTMMNMQKREKLLSVSTTGENAAVKGVLGRIKDVFDRTLERMDDRYNDGFTTTVMYPGAVTGDLTGGAVNIWSLSQYRTDMTGNAPQEDWDELEKSVIASLADEVSISIDNNIVELIIYKDFGRQAPGKAE